MMKWKGLHKIGISGSRSFRFCDSATAMVDDYIRKNFESTEDVVIITGGGLGIDNAFELYCQRRGIKNLIIAARWTELDRAAGPIRNQYIVDLSQELFAFPNETSVGTLDTITKAREKGIPVTVKTEKDMRKLIPQNVRITRDGDIIVKGMVRKKRIPHAIVPDKTPNRIAKKMRQWIEDADIDDLLKKPKKKKFKSPERLF